MISRSPAASRREIGAGPLAAIPASHSTKINEPGRRAAARADWRQHRSSAACALLSLSDSPGGVDQAYVTERLGEVADHLAVAGVALLGEQADIVDGGHGTLEGHGGCLDVPGERLRLRQPERAQQERAL